MPIIHKSIFLLLAGLLQTGLIKAQESVNCSGGNTFGSAGSISYSIGQTLYNTYQAGSGREDQGVQHAYEIYITGIHETESPIYTPVFPNPASDFIIITINSDSHEHFIFELHDMQGKLITTGSITSTQTPIHIQPLPCGNYLLQLCDHNHKNIHSYSIIKN